MAKILCLSDIHYSEKDSSLAYGEKVNDDLIKDMGDALDVLYTSIANLGGIDLFVFCGDYLMGYENNELKEKAKNKFFSFLNKIESSNDIFNCNPKMNRDHMIIVPGNHDINRVDGKELDDFKLRTGSYLTPFEKNKEAHKFAPIFIFNNFKLIIECGSTVNYSATKDKKIEKLIAKISNLNIDNNAKNDINRVLQDYLIYDIPTITEEAVNRFHDSNKKINSNKRYNDYKRIVVTHHPLLNGIENGITIKKFNSTAGGYNFMKTAVSYGYDLFVHGHLHEPSCLQIKDDFLGALDPDISFLQVGVPSFNSENEKPCAVLIETDENNRYENNIKYLKYDSVRREFKQFKFVKFNSEGIITEEKNDTLLIDEDIGKILSENKIIKNGDINNIEAASYDCALGYEYKKSDKKYCDWSKVETQRLESNGKIPGFITLKPNETAFIYTYEEFDLPNDMIMHASPISSWLKKGIRVDISYFVDPGFKGRFGFPIVNESDEDVEINSKEPIMSIELIRLGKSCSKNWHERHPDRCKNREKLKE